MNEIDNNQVSSAPVLSEEGNKRKSIQLPLKKLIITLSAALIITVVYSIIRYTVPDGLVLRTWFNRTVGIILVTLWQIITIVVAVAVCRIAFGKHVVRTAKIAGRILTVVLCVISLGFFAVVGLGMLLDPDTEYDNENDTITVAHSNWLDPSTYSLWKREGLLYRRYIRESAGREDIDPTGSKDAFLRERWPELYEERTDLVTEEQEDNGNPVTVVAYDEQVEANKITDGLVAIYISDFSEDAENRYQTYWSTHGEPEAIIYEDDQVLRYLRYDRISDNERCYLYVYYEAMKTEDGSWSATDASILNMYAYVMDSGAVIASGKKAWSDTGGEEYREATGE